ncbi:Uncharacterised protein [Mycobacteroides abscessus subsp. abscessus]|nr:Uncharacterised protein [Mycobacteroides abscessus subsp. abscessus]
MLSRSQVMHGGGTGVARVHEDICPGRNHPVQHVHDIVVSHTVTVVRRRFEMRWCVECFTISSLRSRRESHREARQGRCQIVRLQMSRGDMWRRGADGQHRDFREVNSPSRHHGHGGADADARDTMTQYLLHGGVAHNTNDAEQSWILTFHSIFGVRRDSHKGIKAIDKVCQLLASVLPGHFGAGYHQDFAGCLDQMLGEVG